MLKINSSCQLLVGYTRFKTFYRSLLNLQKGLHSLGEVIISLCSDVRSVREGGTKAFSECKVLLTSKYIFKVPYRKTIRQRSSL